MYHAGQWFSDKNYLISSRRVDNFSTKMVRFLAQAFGGLLEGVLTPISRQPQRMSSGEISQVKSSALLEFHAWRTIFAESHHVAFWYKSSCSHSLISFPHPSSASIVAADKK